MAKTIKLLSTKGRAQLIERFYFYDGEVPIKDGIVEIPVGRPEWIQRAYIMGYRNDPETEAVITLAEALNGGVKENDSTPEAKPESTESAGEKPDEGSDSGRQPAGDDRVREGQPDSSESIPEQGVGSSSSHGPSFYAGANQPTP